MTKLNWEEDYTFKIEKTKNGCEVYVGNLSYRFFIGECYAGDDKATVLKHANIICDALNQYYLTKGV